uniref:CCHC-type domain-containing protein n=1 Tax=Haemonchus contortus TaxID=6289 RepID=A0A7I4Y631_HAECO
MIGTINNSQPVNVMKFRCQQDIAMQKCTRKDDRNKDQSKTSNAEQSPQGKQERPALNYTRKYDRSNQSTVSRRKQSPSREMKRLQGELHLLKEGLRRLPQRRIGERFRGAGVCAFCKARNDHFSDSCPECIEGDQRFKIITREGICQ